MPNDLERKRQQRAQRNKAKADPAEALRALLLEAAPQLVQQMIEAQKDEVKTLERQLARARKALHLTQKGQPMIDAVLAQAKSRSPSA